jgi:hypothetical protein
MTLSFSTFALVTSKKQVLPDGIVLTKGSLVQLENYQKQQKKDPNKPFLLEMICYKNKKKKSIFSSDTKCRLERIKFTE